MDVTRVFVVEHAGCPSCAQRVRGALAPLTAVEAVDIDEAADCASVTVRSRDGLTEADVNAALAEASPGSGHEYRVQPGSWRAA